MSTFQNKSNELNSYLLHLEAHEKTKRKWKSRIFMGLGALVFLVAISTLSLFSLQPTGETANEEITSPEDIFVELPVMEDSLDEGLFSLSAEPEEIAFETATSGKADLSELDLGLFVEGSKTASAQLNLVILGFDDSFTYELDLGNGSREIVSEPVYPISYQKKGTYKLSLIVSNQEAEKRTFKRSIQIVSEEGASAELKKDREAKPIDEVASSSSITAIPSIETSIGEQELLKTPSPISIPTPTEARETEVLSDSESQKNRQIEESSTQSAPSLNTAKSGNTQFNFRVKEKLPEFKGGKKQLKRYLSKNISYPDDAIQNQIEGNVIVRFAVEPDGSISNPTIVKSLGYGCDEEAIRLVTNMPYWEPGIQGDRAVRAYSLVSIRFNMW